MTPTEAFISNIRGIAADQARLLEEERRLLARKRKLDDQMRKAIEAFSGLDGTPARPGVSIGVDAEYAPKVPGADKGKSESGPAIAARRRYMTAVMEACRSVMLALGHPLSVAEIMSVHPERSRISAHAVGKAIDLRTRQARPEFAALKGFYWVSDKPLPEGWSHPKGHDVAVTPEAVRQGELTRARRKALVASEESKLLAMAAMLEGGWVPMRRTRRSVVEKAKASTTPARGRTFNVKGLMTSLNHIRASNGQPVVHFEAWPKSREDAQPYIDEVRAFRRRRT